MTWRRPFEGDLPLLTAQRATWESQRETKRRGEALTATLWNNLPKTEASKMFM